MPLLNPSKAGESKAASSDKPSKSSKSKSSKSSGDKAKKNKPPSKPPAKGQALYVKEHRSAYKKENEETDGKKITKDLREQYDDLTEEEKAKWDKKAADGTEKFKSEFAQWEADHPEEAAERKEKSKKRKKSKEASGSDSDGSEDEKPKAKKAKTKKGEKKKGGGTSGYMVFSSAMRSTVNKEMPDLAPTDVMKELGKRWKELSKAEQGSYNEQAKANKEKAKKDEEEDGDDKAEANGHGKENGVAADDESE